MLLGLTTTKLHCYESTAWLYIFYLIHFFSSIINYLMGLAARLCWLAALFALACCPTCEGLLPHLCWLAAPLVLACCPPSCWFVTEFFLPPTLCTWTGLLYAWTGLLPLLFSLLLLSALPPCFWTPAQSSWFLATQLSQCHCNYHTPYPTATAEGCGEFELPTW